MKRICCLAAAALLTLLIGSDAVCAADAGVRFTPVRTMDISTFSDVSVESWFYSGVKTAYDCAVMDGTGKGMFSPESHVTLAQAIAVAARLHSIRTNTDIEEKDSAQWYEKYLAYAKENALLPPGIGESEAPDGQNAARAEIAYMFCRAADAATLPAINDLLIPDIGQIDAQYADAVRTMYSSGIIGGKEGGSFDGEGLATRAEIAVIIGRLVDPLNRLAHDEKYNGPVTGQEGNIQDYQKVLEDGDMIYFVYWDDAASGCNVAQRNVKTGKSAVIYRGQPGLSKNDYPYVRQLNRYENDLYLVSDEYNTGAGGCESNLKKISLDTKTATTLYSGAYISGYTIYGGEIYLIDSSSAPGRGSGPEAAYSYRLIKLNGRTAERYAAGNGFAYNLSAFDNCLYYYVSGRIMKAELSTKHVSPIVENVGGVIFCGGTAYFADTRGDIYSILLRDVSVKKLLYQGGEAAAGGIQSLNRRNGCLYFKFSQQPRICRIDPAGRCSSDEIGEADARFGIIDGHYLYTDGGGNEYVAPFGCEPTRRQNLGRWLFNPDGGPLNALPPITVETGEKLSPEEIYAKCAPALIYIETYDSEQRALRRGGGFFITGDGMAATSFRVLEGASYARAVLSDGRVFWIDSVVGQSAAKDIALFTIPGGGFRCLEIGDSSRVAVGQIVYTVTSPYASAESVVSGSVSDLKYDAGGSARFCVQSAISPDIGGNAFINEYGQAIGIASVSYSDGQPLCLAVPAADIYSIVLKT